MIFVLNKIKMHIIAISIIVLMSWINTATSQQWEFLGFTDQIIYSIAIDPQNPEIMYVGTEATDLNTEIGIGAIFKTFNGGSNWDTLATNIFQPKLVINPKDTDIIYRFSGKIYKSEDAGLNWVKSDSGINYAQFASVTLLAIDQNHPDTLYSGTGGFDHTGPFKSINGGRSWHSIWGNIDLWDSIFSILITKDSTNILYLATDGRGSIYKSINGGESYENLTGNLWSGAIIFSLLISPSKGNILYAGGLFGNSDYDTWWISKSIDDGNSWVIADSGMFGDKVQSMVINENDENILYAGINTGLFKTINAATSWFQIETSYLASCDIQCLTFHPYDPNIIYVGTKKGVYRFTEKSDVNLHQNQESQVPEIGLFQNYPNPFNNRTVIRYYLSKFGHVTIAIYNLKGQLIRVLIDKSIDSGYHEVLWNGKDRESKSVCSGLYFCKIRHNSYTKIMKLVLIE